VLRRRRLDLRKTNPGRQNLSKPNTNGPAPSRSASVRDRAAKEFTRFVDHSFQIPSTFSPEPVAAPVTEGSSRSTADEIHSAAP